MGEVRCGHKTQRREVKFGRSDFRAGRGWEAGAEGRELVKVPTPHFPDADPERARLDPEKTGAEKMRRRLAEVRDLSSPISQHEVGRSGGQIWHRALQPEQREKCVWLKGPLCP